MLSLGFRGELHSSPVLFPLLCSYWLLCAGFCVGAGTSLALYLSLEAVVVRLLARDFLLGEHSIQIII